MSIANYCKVWGETGSPCDDLTCEICVAANSVDLKKRYDRQLQDHVDDKARILREYEEKVKKLEAQLPEGMKHCTIVFKKCSLGHGWLTSTFWVQHDCPTCEANALKSDITFWKDRAESMTRSANGFYEAICQRLKPFFPAGTRDLDHDVMPATITKMAQDLKDAREKLSKGVSLVKKKATGVKNPRLLLWLHMVSEHAGIFHPFDTLASLMDLHHHEHNGPGGIRNHDEADRTYHIQDVGKVLSEAENPDPAFDHEGQAK